MSVQVAAEIAKLMGFVTVDTQRFVLDVLRQDAADRAWAAQLGSVLSQADVARLLGKSEQAVSKDRGLLRVKLRSGRVAYPVVQFAGRSVVKGIAEVCAASSGVVESLTVASWLTAKNRALEGQRPVDVLRAGDVDSVVTLARRLAARLT